MLNTNNYKNIKIDNSIDYDINTKIPKIKIIRNNYKIKGGVANKNEGYKNNELITKDNIITENNNDNHIQNDKSKKDLLNINETNLLNDEKYQFNDETDLLNDETDLLNDETDLLNDKTEFINTNNKLSFLEDTKLKEMDDIDFLNEINIGDKVRIISNSESNIFEGFITFYDNNSFEISNKTGVTEKFFFKNNKINNTNKLFIISKTDNPGYISFMNLKSNSEVKITSKNKEFDQKIGVIDSIDGENINIIFDDDTEPLTYNLEYGLSKDYMIQRLESISNLEYNREITDQINFIEDSNLKLTEQRNINEDDYIISSFQATEMLTNQLIEIIYRDNIYDKYKSVKQIVINLSFILDKVSKYYQLNDLEKKKYNNKILSNIFNYDFRNINIIPLTSIKHIVYENKTNEEVTYSDHVIFRNDNFFKSELINISENPNKNFRKNSDFISYNHYINKLNELLLPSELDNDKHLGFEINLNDSLDVFSTQPSRISFLANRFLGKDYLSSEQIIEPESSDTVSNTYTQNYWMSEKHYRLNKIYDGNKLNIYAFIIIPFSNPNFDITGNRVNLIDIKNKNYKSLGEYVSKVKKKSIQIDLNDTKKINYKELRGKIVQINFNQNSSFTQKDYYDMIEQITPSLIDLIPKKHYKFIKSLEDINNYLIEWDIRIENQNYNQFRPFLKIISNNLLNTNKLDYKSIIKKYIEEYDQLLKDKYEKKNIDIIVSNEILNSEEFKEIYGAYPYLNTLIDSQSTRFDWIFNNFQNGTYFIVKFINKQIDYDNDENIIEANKKLIEKLNYDINSSIIELNNLNVNNCKYIFISYIFSSIEEKNREKNNILNKYSILKDSENNFLIFKGFKKDGINTWIEYDEKINKIEFIYYDHILISENKYKAIIKEINSIINKNTCINNQFLNNLNLIDSTQKDLITKINTIKYKINEYEKSIDYFTNKNKEIIDKKIFLQNTKIKISNFINEKKYNSEDLNKENILEKGKNSNSKLKKEFDKLTLELDIDSRNDKIYSFINNKLRKANPNEDPDFYYDPDSDEKIAAIDWNLETLMTKEPEKYEFYKKELIYNYTQKIDGYYRSIIDGRQLFPVEYDDFAGYENDNGEVNIHREIIYQEDNFNQINEIDKKIKEIEKQVSEYNIDKIILILENYLLETTNNLSPLKKKDRFFLYQNIINDLENNKANTFKSVSSEFKKKFNKDYDYNNPEDRRNLNKIKEMYINIYLIRQTISLFIIVIQSSIPQYSIKVNRIKKCEYSLSGYPFDDINFSDSSLLKYITCVLSYISNSELSNNFLTNIVKKYKEEDFFNKIFEKFKLWYNNNSEVKIRYQEFINNKELNDTSFIDNKIPLGFKPNPVFYNNFNQDNNLFLKNLDILINKDKQKKTFSNKYSNNCCLNNIKNEYYYFFKNIETDDNYQDLYDKASDKLIYINRTSQNNFVKLNDNLNESDINKNNIYPNYFDQDLAIKLFTKYTLDGEKRIINFNINKCLITGEESELFLFSYYNDPNLLLDYEGKKAYEKFKNDLEKKMKDRRNIVKKENIKILENLEIKNYLSLINKKNIIDIDLDKRIYNNNKIIILEDIYKNINHYFESNLLKKLINDMKILSQNISGLNNQDIKIEKNNYNNIFQNDVEKSIKSIQKNIIERIKNRIEDNNINLSYFEELDKNARMLFNDNRKNTYNQYFNIIIINLSKFYENKRNNINIPNNWNASTDNIIILEKNINKNNQIYDLNEQNNDSELQINEIVSLLLSSLSSIYKYLNLLSYDNEEFDGFDLDNSNIQFNINDYFEIYKFIFYVSIYEIIRYRPSKDYNHFSTNFIMILIQQINDLIIKFNKTSEEVQNEVISQTENERQIHIKRVNDLRDENRKIDNELKKYKLGDFYGQNGKEDWERGLSVDKQYTDIANNDNLFYIPTKIDKGSELLDLQNEFYKDENDDN